MIILESVGSDSLYGSYQKREVRLQILSEAKREKLSILIIMAYGMCLLVLFILSILIHESYGFSCPQMSHSSTPIKCSCDLKKDGSVVFSPEPESKGAIACSGDTVDDEALSKYSEYIIGTNALCHDPLNDGPDLENEVYRKRSTSHERSKDKSGSIGTNWSPARFCQLQKLTLNKTSVHMFNDTLFSNAYVTELRLIHNYQLEHLSVFSLNMSRSSLRVFEVMYAKISSNDVINFAVMFENLEEFKMLLGNLESIDKNSFGRGNFRNLLTLDLSDNLISKIADHSFYDMISLKTLKLSNNNLHQVSQNMLTFAPPTYKFVNQKIHIMLDKNHVSTDLTDPKSLSSFLRPVTLDLSNNLLNSLPERPFKTFLFSDHRNSIDIKSNPLICDETNGWILKHVSYMNYSRGGSDDDVNPDYRTEVLGDLTFLYERSQPDYSYYKIRDFICENGSNIFAI